MESLHPQIVRAFGQGVPPPETALVHWDGFDQLEKECAVRFYSGKTWQDVLAHLRGLKDASVFRAAYFLEEWSVLSPMALAYHTRAHLEFLSETLASATPNEEFVFQFFGQLYQVMYMHKGSPFNPAQTDLLRQVAQRIKQKAAAMDSFEYLRMTSRRRSTGSSPSWPRMTGNTIGLLILATGLLRSTAAAQRAGPPRSQNDIEQHPIAGMRPTAQWHGDDEVKGRCPSFVLADSTFTEAQTRPATAPLRTWCTVDTSYTLPNADGTRWLTVVYSRSSEYAGTTRDTVVLVTAALYSFRDHRLSWSPEWVGTVAREITWSVQLDAVQRPDRSMLLAFRYCLSGTGGCWQRYLRRHNGKWTPVEELFWSQLPSIPRGRVGKGRGINVGTLSGSYGVYSDTDGNCCPSREIFLRLELRGDTLMLAGYELRGDTLMLAGYELRGTRY